MKETEILRGLDKARAKRAQAVQKFADGVVQAQPRPSPMSLRGLAQAIGNGFETMSTGAANLAERVIPIRSQPVPAAASAPTPMPAAPAPAAVTPGLGAIGEYSGGMQGTLQRREREAGLYADGVAEVQPSPLSLRGLGRAIGNGFESMSTGAANLMERAVPIRPRPAPAAPMAAPAPAPVMTPAPAATVPGLGALSDYAGGMQGTMQRREAAAGLRSGVAQLEGPGTETSDDIPAWLSKGEAVLPAKTVQAIGPKNIARLIADTNGKPPVDGAKHGLRAASGVVLPDLPDLDLNRSVGPQPMPEAMRQPSSAPTPSPSSAPAPMDGVRNPNVGPKGSVEAQAWRQTQTVAPTQPAAPTAVPTPAEARARINPAITTEQVKRVLQPATRAAKTVAKAGTWLGRGVAPVAAAVDAADVVDVVTDKNMDGVDVANEVASKTGKWGAFGAGATAGALAGTAAGPLAPIAVPALGLLGGAASYYAADKTIKGLRGTAGVETTDPSERSNGVVKKTVDAVTGRTPAAAPAPARGLSAATGAADNRDPYAAANAAKLAAPLQLPKGAMDPETGLMEGVVDRSGNSFAGQNITAGPTDANPGMGGNAGSRAADARASAIYRQIIDEGAREGDAARASATATNDALERSFNNEQNQREIRRGLSQARYEASKLYGRPKAAALDSILKAEQEAAQAPEKLDIERSKAAGLNSDAKARMMQSWLQHQDNLGERRADREQRASDAAAQRALTAATAQRQAQKDAAEADSRNYEASGKEFDRLFDDTDAKGAPRRREDLEALATLTAQRNSGGKWRTMSTADRAKAREDAVETVKFISAARDGQNNEWLQALGLKQPDAVLDYLPQLKGRKLEKAGIWEGASTPNASIGDYVIRMPNGKDMYLPYGKVTEGTLAFLKKQGVDIGGLKNGG